MRDVGSTRELAHKLVSDLIVGGAPLALHFLAHFHAEVSQPLAIVAAACGLRTIAPCAVGHNAPGRRPAARGLIEGIAENLTLTAGISLPAI